MSPFSLAINGFISALAGWDAEAAGVWAAEITEPKMRESAMVRAGQQFFRQDQSAAETWFQSTGLSENVLGKMIQADLPNR